MTESIRTTESSGPPPIKASDLAGVDQLLTPEEIAVRSTVRELCRDGVEPRVADWFERGEIDDVRGLAKTLGAVGLFGMHLEG